MKENYCVCSTLSYVVNWCMSDLHTEYNPGSFYVLVRKDLR